MHDLVWLVIATVPLLVLSVGAIVEISWRSDLPVRHRVAWVAVLVALPPIGLAAYVVFRPPPRPTTTHGTGGGSSAELLVVVAERHQRGEIDDDEYRAEMARLQRELVSRE